jgi:D-xylose transport system substrate-binding protein
MLQTSFGLPLFSKRRLKKSQLVAFERGNYMRVLSSYTFRSDALKKKIQQVEHISHRTSEGRKVMNWERTPEPALYAFHVRCYLPCNTRGGASMLTFRLKGMQPYLLAVAIFCSFSLLQAQDKPATSGPLKIGFLMDSLKIERWHTDLDNFQKRAKELGAEVLVETAEGDDELQLQQAQKLLSAGVKSLVLVSHDSEKAVRIVNAAKAKHVPLLCYERLVRNADVGFFVGVDATAIGILQADFLTQRAPRGNYVLIGGSASDINARILHDAQSKALKPMVDRGDIKIVSDTWSKDWSPSEAYAHMSEALESTKGDITAVVASNDGTAGGAIQALEEHKLAGKVLVSGQDADLAAIIRILDGTQTMTIYKPLGSQAKLAAEAAVALAKGEPLQNTAAISIGSKTIPAILLIPVVVTKNNVKQTVIKDGFQNLETIQKSLPKEKWPQ